jgi:hypothetical protein
LPAIHLSAFDKSSIWIRAGCDRLTDFNAMEGHSTVEVAVYAKHFDGIHLIPRSSVQSVVHNEVRELWNSDSPQSDCRESQHPPER